MLDFGAALKCLKDGMKATRNGWQPYGMYVVLQSDNLLVMRTPSGAVSWGAVSSDLLGEDWLVATSDGDITWPDGTVA